MTRSSIVTQKGLFITIVHLDCSAKADIGVFSSPFSNAVFLGEVGAEPTFWMGSNHVNN